jgi:hypothetical protein
MAVTLTIHILTFGTEGANCTTQPFEVVLQYSELSSRTIQSIQAQVSESEGVDQDEVLLYNLLPSVSPSVLDSLDQFTNRWNGQQDWLPSDIESQIPGAVWLHNPTCHLSDTLMLEHDHDHDHDQQLNFQLLAVINDHTSLAEPPAYAITEAGMCRCKR